MNHACLLHRLWNKPCEEIKHRCTQGGVQLQNWWKYTYIHIYIFIVRKIYNIRCLHVKPIFDSGCFLNRPYNKYEQSKTCNFLLYIFLAKIIFVISSKMHLTKICKKPWTFSSSQIIFSYIANSSYLYHKLFKRLCRTWAWIFVTLKL